MPEDRKPRHDAENAPVPPDRKRVRRRVTAVIAMLLTLGIVSLVALPHIAGARRGLAGHVFGGGLAEEHVGFAVDWLLHRIDASDEQAESVHAIVGDALEELLALREGHAEVHDTLVAELTAERVDPLTLEALRARQVEEVDRVSRRLVGVAVELGRVLTPEQRQDLVALLERMRPHRRHGR